MAVSTQDIQNYLAANPGLTDAQIAAAMDQYGVSASQLAAATGLGEQAVADRYAAAVGNLTPTQLSQFTSYLTPETLNQIYGGLADDMLPGGFRPQLGYEWDSMEAQIGGGPGRATIAGYSGPIGQDDMYSAYSPTGEFLGRYQADDDGWKALLPIAMALGGQFLFGGGLGGAGAAGAAGTTAGSVTPGAWLSAAADSQLANLALGADALAGYTAAGAIPTAVNIGGTLYSAGAPISSIFNPAVDSQIANEAIAAAGGNPLTGYFDPSLTPATVQIGDLTYGAGAPVVTATGAPAPTGGIPTGGGGGTTTTPGGLPPGVTTTLTNLLNNPGNLAGLLGLLGGGGGVPMGIGSIPTQGMPTNSPEYFNQVQGFLNQYLPGQMPTQSQYLSSWYNNTPGSYMPGGGGMMNPPAPAPAPAPAQGGGKGKGRDNRPVRDTGPRRPVPAPLPPVSLEDIRGYLGSRPGMTDQEIAAAMQQYGVSPQQMAEATGVPYSEVLQRYLDAKQANLTNSILSSMQG